MKQRVLYRRNDHKKLLFNCLKYLLQLGSFYHLVNRPLRWIAEVRQGTLPLPAYPPSDIIIELGLQLLQSCPSHQHVFTSCFHYAILCYCDGFAFNNLLDANIQTWGRSTISPYGHIPALTRWWPFFATFVLFYSWCSKVLVSKDLNLLRRRGRCIIKPTVTWI